LDKIICSLASEKSQHLHLKIVLNLHLHFLLGAKEFNMDEKYIQEYLKK
jgi:hypothetical protein